MQYEVTVYTDYWHTLSDVKGKFEEIEGAIKAGVTYSANEPDSVFALASVDDPEDILGMFHDGKYYTEAQGQE